MEAGRGRVLLPLLAAQEHLLRTELVALPFTHAGFPLYTTPPPQPIKPCSEGTPTQSLQAAILYEIYISGTWHYILLIYLYNLDV